MPKSFPQSNFLGKMIGGPPCGDPPFFLRDFIYSPDSLVDRIRKVKDVDILLTAISEEKEFPLLLVEYSTAVPTDDHKMQRSDVYFWGSVFKAPMMKISPSSKGMAQGFGGGSKFSDEYERVIAYRQGAVFYPIKWESSEQADVLPTKTQALSCIDHSPEICDIIRMLLSEFGSACDFGSYYQSLRDKYSARYASVLSSPDYTPEKGKEYLVNSTRFHWHDDRLSVKINRFGHAMDPDRGVLYFVNMLVGFENTIAEIQVNRDGVNCRGGYHSLFDALARKDALLKYVEEIITNRGNVFTAEEALYVFLHALHLENALTLTKTADGHYCVEDHVLEHFLRTHTSITSKSIFFLSSELRLTDKNRETICTVSWNKAPVDAFLSSIQTNNFTPIGITPLTYKDAKEDIVTFASVELYKKMNYSLLAVSYPGAQGDRCVLTGSGRKVLRTFVDIIAYKKCDSGVSLFLEECKDVFSKILPDVKKLAELKNTPEKRAGLALLLEHTTNERNVAEIFTSVAAKCSCDLPYLDVDYIFMFDVGSKSGKTYINYQVALINTGLLPDFLPLAEDGKRLQGTLAFDEIFVVQ